MSATLTHSRIKKESKRAQEERMGFVLMLLERIENGAGVRECLDESQESISIYRYNTRREG